MRLKLRFWGPLVRRYGTKSAVLLLTIPVLFMGGGVTYAALLIGGGSNQNGINLQSGLVGYWKFDGNTTDSSSYGNNGTITGTVASTTGRDGTVNGAYMFDDSGYIIVPDSPSLNIQGDGVTISAWFKPSVDVTAMNASYPILAIKRPWQVGGYAAHFTKSNGEINVQYCFTGSCASASNGTALLSNTWYHYVGMVDGNKLYTYINGALVKESTTSGNAIGSSAGTNLVIGNDFEGVIDNLRIYNRAISGDEAAALYKLSAPVLKVASGQKGLIGHWKMDGDMKDSSPYQHHGTLNSLTLAADRKGKTNGALSFAGAATSNSIINNMDNFPTTEITNSMWVKTTGVDRALISFAPSGGNDWLLLGFSSLRVYLGTQNRITGVGFNDGLWHHIAVTWRSSDGSLKVYKDGTQAYSDTFQAGYVLPSNGCLVFGQDQDTACGGFNSAQAFAGEMDDVRIYNRALSAEEIATQAASYDSQINLHRSSSSTGGSINLSSGLIGYWAMDGNARDGTPYGNNGTVNGATLTSDRNGHANKAYLLKDTNGWIGVGAPGIFSNLTATGFTYSIWVMRTGTSVNQWPEIMGANNTHTYYGIRGYNYGNNVAFEYGKSPFDGSSYSNIGNTSLPVNEWHMFTATYDGTNLNFYKDDSLIAGPSAQSLNPTFWGINFTNGSNGFAGSVDEARVYKRALSATEVQALYENAN